METLAFGFGLIEGPRYAPDGSLYFSDVHHGGVRRLTPDGEVEVVIPKRRGVGGIALHADGGLVVSGRNVCHVRDGVSRILYERDDVGGFNDLFADAAGRVICGSLRDDPFAVEPVGAGRLTGDCYRVDRPGVAVTLYEGVALSNGIGFSPDGTVLYHCDTWVGVVAHDVAADGGVVPGSRRLFARSDRGAVDGLVVDREGGVWVAVYDGGCVVRFTPDGAFHRRIDVPARKVTSLVFGGPDLDQLYVVTADNTDRPERGGTVFRLDAAAVGAVGLPPPLVRI